MERESTGKSQEKSRDLNNYYYNHETNNYLVDSSWSISIEKKLWGIDPSCASFSQCDRSKEPTIFRVPDNIRACDPEAYEPLVVALGPFKHQGYRCPSSIEAMNKYKWRCMRFLLTRHLDTHLSTTILRECLAAVKAMEMCARGCYMCDPSLQALSSEEFAEMLLLDGCFILHTLLTRCEKETRRVEVIIGKNKLEPAICPMEEEVADEGEMRSVGGLWSWSFVKYDLLKLENQIPFFVIQKLFDLLKSPKEADADLVEIAFDFFRVFHPRRTGPPLPAPRRVHHLLHLYHHSLLPTAEEAGSTNGKPNANPREWIPSATELRESGVKFRKKADGYSCLDITYRKGVVEIPTLHLCKYSSTVFRNLMAFEQCFPVSPHVTNYALFMDCILHSGAEDMRLLHLRGIVVNRQSSDEEAAMFFNNLSKEIHYGYESNYLENVLEEVMAYTESRWNRWRASLVREYFSSPWVIISVAAAIFLLLLTLLQAFFAAYAYFLPS